LIHNARGPFFGHELNFRSISLDCRNGEARVEDEDFYRLNRSCRWGSAGSYAGTSLPMQALLSGPVPIPVILLPPGEKRDAASGG
jgi:hypothetical protein